MRERGADDGTHTSTTNPGGVFSLDIVVPLYNEEDMVRALFSRLETVFSTSALEEHGIRDVRYIVVDDGSTDNTAEMVKENIEAGLPAVLIRLTRNFGHQNALSAGLAHAGADLVAVIDGDLQDPPEIILEMVDAWRKGFNVVHGQRRRRRGNPIKRFSYWSFYRLIGFLADVKMPLDSGDFCLMERRVVQAICRLPENQRFIRGLRAWVGFRQTAIAYDRPERVAGKPKYTIRKLYSLATDGIASMSIRPLRIAQLFSLIMMFLSVVLWLLLVAQLTSITPQFMRADTLILALLVTSGNAVLLLCIYILGAYIGRGYLELKGRPPYIILEVFQYNAAASSEPCSENKSVAH